MALVVRGRAVWRCAVVENAHRQTDSEYETCQSTLNQSQGRVYYISRAADGRLCSTWRILLPNIDLDSNDISSSGAIPIQEVTHKRCTSIPCSRPTMDTREVIMEGLIFSSRYYHCTISWDVLLLC